MKRQILNVLVVALMGTIFNVHMHASQPSITTNNNKKGILAMCAVGATVAALYYGSPLIKRFWKSRTIVNQDRNNEQRRPDDENRHRQPIVAPVVQSQSSRSAPSSRQLTDEEIRAIAQSLMPQPPVIDPPITPVPGQIGGGLESSSSSKDEVTSLCYEAQQEPEKIAQPIFLDQIEGLLACLQNMVNGNEDRSYAEIIDRVEQKAAELDHLPHSRSGFLSKHYLQELQREIKISKILKNVYLVQFLIADIIQYMLNLEHHFAAINNQHYNQMLIQIDALRKASYEKESHKQKLKKQELAAQQNLLIEEQQKLLLGSSTLGSTTLEERATAAMLDAHFMLEQVEALSDDLEESKSQCESQLDGSSDDNSIQEFLDNFFEPISSTATTSASSSASSSEASSLRATPSFLNREKTKVQTKRYTKLMSEDIEKIALALSALEEINALLVKMPTGDKKNKEYQRERAFMKMGKHIITVESKVRKMHSGWRTRELEPNSLVTLIKSAYIMGEVSDIAKNVTKLIALLQDINAKYVAKLNQ